MNVLHSVLIICVLMLSVNAFKLGHSLVQTAGVVALRAGTATGANRINYPLKVSSAIQLPFHVRGTRMFATTTENSNEQMKTYILEYTYVDDIAERRDPFRPGHIEVAKKGVEDNTIIAGGAFTPGLEGALFLFRCTSKDVIEEFVKSDPYVVNGLVPEYKIMEWNVVVGTI